MHAYYTAREESMNGSLRQRQNGIVKKNNNVIQEVEERKYDEDHDTLNLMEQLMVMSLRKQTTTLLSINITGEKLSLALRGALLIELELNGYIALEKKTQFNYKLSDRKVIAKRTDRISDSLMNQCMTHIIKYSGKYNIRTWILLLSGQSLNFMMIHTHIRLMRERICKNLVEKGVLECGFETNFFLTMHSFKFKNREEQRKVLIKFQKGLLSGYQVEYTKFDPRVLALIYLTFAAEAENLPTECLSDDDYVRAMNNLYKIKNSNFNELAMKRSDNFGEIFWGVFDVFKSLFNL
uniref:Golgi phosphoprotein 3 (GPP34) n=1 Tax=Parastrongyloides trichosuri TaxID=131310 RepID=A0A0N4ZZG7_PARTI